MNVAIISPVLFRGGRVVGGGERYAIELARALSRRVNTRLLTVGPRRERRWVENLQIEVFPGRGGVRGDLSNPWSPEFLRGAAGCQVLHCLCYNKLLADLSILWGRLTGRRVFCTDVGGGGPCLSTYAVRAGLPGTGRLCHGHLALSNFASCYFQQSFRQARVVYGGVDASVYRPDGRPRDRSVAFVGRLLPHKGIDRLIHCLPTEVPLTVAGRPYDVAYLQHLRRLAAGKSVTFRFDPSDDELKRLYQRTGVLVLPSVYQDYRGHFHSVPELLGLTLLEAMACGAPTVCTDVGAMPEVVSHGKTGLVVPPGDATALREAVLTILGQEDLSTEMGAAGRRQVLAKFTWDATATRCCRAYEELQ